MTNRITRLAPSPTGALHLGNACTFLVNWAIARRAGWSIVMRIEDLDGPRIRADAAERTIDMLTWLGLDFDGEAIFQSADLDPYRDTARRLADAGLLFPCALTRTEIARAASAPHDGEHELRFDPALRPAEGAGPFADEDVNYRLLVDDETIEIDDVCAGRVAFNPHREVGDFVVWTRRGTPSYQLAVVVDDARQGVTDVVRGRDLLPSAARQTLLYRALGLAPPRWWHLPLVRGIDGRRLAKRHGDTRLATYRERGVAPERIVGLLARWCGITEASEPMTAADFRDRLDPASLSREDLTFTEDDDRWLRA